MSVRALLLGTPRISHDGAETVLPATRPVAVLAYLACRGDWVTRDEVALMLRPDAGDAEARVYLRKLIFRARAFPFAGALEVIDERLRWAVACDVTDLRRAVATGAWPEAARLYDGPLLDGFGIAGLPGFEAWLEIEREAVATSWRRAIVARASELEAAGAVMEAVACRERYLAREPLDESIVQDLLRALTAVGERGRGLAAFEAFARTLEREIGVEPAEVTQTLADALRALPSTPAPASRTAGTRAAGGGEGRLPRPATPFVGRRDEIVRLATLLEPGGPRLVTLTGLGGVGKSRLALETVRHLAGPSPARVVYVSLPSAPPGSRLVEAVATALDVDPDEGRLLATLADDAALLVLDGAEHVGRGVVAREADALLRGAPHLRMIVTSRVPIGLAAEHIVQVDGLGVPDAHGDVRDSDAVTLFLRRAAAVSPEIIDGDDTLRLVGEICRSLGGLPLAIELAASWTRTMSIEALLAELRAGEDLLRTDASDVPERQRSMRVVLDHAWQGLRPDHREALGRLTVFHGSWSLAAAREVAGADLDTMVALLSSSLVNRRDRDRYEMHELVRRSAPPVVDEATRDAHARHVLGWLSDLERDLVAGDQAGALGAVHAALADVRVAWHHAAARGMQGEIARALVPLDYALHARSLWSVAREAYRTALDHLPASPSAAATRVRLQVRLANIERNVGDSEAARSLLQAAASDPEASRGRPQVERRLELAKLDESVSALAAAEVSYRVVLSDAGPDDDDLRGAAHTGLGNVLFSAGGDHAEAMRHYDDGLRVARRSGDTDLVTIALINQGAGHYDLGQYDAAHRSWREAADLAARLGYRLREASVRNNLAALAERSGDLAEAREAYGRSLAVRHEIGDRRGAGHVLLNLGRLAQREGRLEEADALVEAAVNAYGELDVPADLAHALAAHARLRVALGDEGGATRLTERALRLGRLAADRTAMLVGLLSAAAISLHQGRLEEARDDAARVAELAIIDRDGVRSSALALVQEAVARGASSVEPFRDPSGDRGATFAGPPETEAALAREVERVLRRG